MTTFRSLSALLLAFFLLKAAPATAQSYDCSAQSDVPQAECAALVALYSSTDGDNWYDNSGWLSDPVDQWSGVEVNGGRVTSLILDNNGLSGAIPAELGQLGSVRLVRLGRNSLDGTIPAELGQLTSLEEIYLNNNSLGGTIPAELGQLSNLRELNFSRNSLSGAIPPELGQLTSLKGLLLFWNSLSGPIPIELAQSTNLENLYLDSNDLSGAIPPELAQLANLQRLALSSNELDGSIPSELGNLINLQILYLSDNNFSGAVPVELAQLTRLQELWLHSNGLSGPIPLEFTNLRALNYFYFYDTGLCEPQNEDFEAWIDGITFLSGNSSKCTPTPIESTDADQPGDFTLEANYPNPFNPSTTIKYVIPVATHVMLAVYDLQGRELLRLVDTWQAPGVYHARFEAADLPSGVYLYRLQAGSYRNAKTLTLAR